ncbi:MAG: efflux RND transporter permease subunit [Bacteroidetes bacterium]|nr:efflux RND transporter permease subunit [Bacteroidota bacterium]
MKITAFAINKNRITFTLMFVLLMAGITTYTNMPRNEDPGFIIRVASIVTQFPGASPDRMELLISDPIEKVIQEIPELDFVTSSNKTGISTIFVNIKESEKNMRPIWDNVRRKVDKVRAELPDGIIGPTVNDEYGDVFGIIVGMTAEGYTYAEAKDIADDVRDELLDIPDAAKVEISGAQKERIFVEYDNARLNELGLTSFMLKTILDSRNIIIPGGNIRVGNERLALEPSGNFESLEELKRTIVNIPGKQDVVYLEDIAQIYRGYVDPVELKTKINGIPGLAISISLREGGNILNLGKEVEQKMATFNQIYPIGVEFEMIAYQHIIVENKVNDFISNLLQAIAVVLAVMLLFMGFRTGLVVASLIPMTLITSIFVMDIFGIGLDQISLAALIIALGMLVDNAIVMSESIMVRMEHGENAFDAAMASTKELMIPLLTSSLTTSAAFLPIFLAKSTVGEYTASLFKVVTIALLISWIFSLTMIPMLCVKYLRIKPKMEESKPGKFFNSYQSFLMFSLKKPAIFLGGLILVFIFSMYLFRFVPGKFFPDKDRNMVTVQIEFPIGTAIEKNEEVMVELERFIKDSLQFTEERPDGVINWASWIGSSAPKYTLSYNPLPPSSENSYILLNTTDWKLNIQMANRIEMFCNLRYPDMSVVASSLLNGPPVTDPIEIRISGKETDKLFELVGVVKSQVSEIEGTKNTKDDWGIRTKKIYVDINQSRAKLAGVTSQDIAISLQTVLSGFQTGDFREDEKIIPITMRNVAADRDDLGKLESLGIFSQQTGHSVPLSQVADIQVEWQPAIIKRRDRYQTVTIQSQVKDGVSAIDLIKSELMPIMEKTSQNWPVGYKYEFGGEIESSEKGNKSIGAQLPIGGLIILLLLIAQFNSFRKTFIILITIPLGLIGVVVGLLVLDSYMGFITFLGVISLAGIVINNGIVLIDRIQIELDENKMEPQDAIIEATKQRFRPILLTTATTFMGLIPLYLGGGPMFEPMAIAIIFGLIFATVLTLVFVPVMYRLLYRVSFKNY